MSDPLGGSDPFASYSSANGFIARDAALRERIVPDLAAAAPFASARIAAVEGQRYPDHFLWGEIA